MTNREKFAEQILDIACSNNRIAVDTSILVNDSNDHRWLKRYFAKYENGSVFAWNGGKTSWSSEGHATAWILAKLPERSSNEEINK